jgi:hypothetical protein
MAATHAAEISTVARRLGLLRETIGPPGDTRNRAVRAALVPVLSATTITAERPGPIRRAEVPASVAERRAAVVVAAVAIINRITKNLQ